MILIGEIFEIYLYTLQENRAENENMREMRICER